MKRQIFLFQYSIILVLSVNGQANTKLSNLVAPTAVNQHLLPNTANSKDLGNTTLGWRNLYLRGAVYLDGTRFVSNDPGGSQFNAFLGSNAGISTTGINNTAMGHNALYRNTTGQSNTTAGAFSLFSNTTGSSNTALGLRALHKNTTGTGNSSSGFYAMYNNTTGTYCTAHGYEALYSNTTGLYNVAVGFQSQYNNTGNSYNTTVGLYSGYYNSSAGTFLGAYAYSNPNLTNVTAIGYAAFAPASNQVRIGNSSVTSIGGQVGWTTFSDGRFKKNIQADVPGLDFIIQLKPVTYTLDMNGLNNAINSNRPQLKDGQGEPGPSTEEIAGWQEQAQMKQTGFIAQAVEETAQKLNYAFSGVDKPKNNQDFYGLRYAEFVVPLVKAVQELSATDDKVKQEVRDLMEENKQLKEELTQLKQTVLELKQGTGSNGSNTFKAYLEQGTPNPTASSTQIRYYIPQSSGTAHIVFTDIKGAIIKSITLSNKGAGQLSVNTAAWTAGTYTYTIYINGTQAHSQKLVIAR